MTAPRSAAAGDSHVLAGIKRTVVAHYESQLALHGPTPLGMDWKDPESQELRFRVLCGVCDLEGRSLREVGAGAGHLVDHLRARGVRARYSGIDLSGAMVQAARRRHPDVAFEHRDLLEDPAPEAVDVTLASGVFHVKLDSDEVAFERFVRTTLHRMFQTSRVAIAFNLMSDQVDFRSPRLYYANAGDTLDFCRRELSRFVVLRHDYPLYEYSVYVYREGFRP